MYGRRESIPYPQLVFALGVLPMAFTTFLSEPFGIAVPAAAWAILSGVSWYVGRNLAAVGWFLFFLLAAGFALVRNRIDGTPVLILFFGCLVFAFGFVVADAYYNGQYEETTTA